MIDPEVINASNVKEENYLITEETIMNDNFKSNESIGNIDVNSGLAIGSNESSKNMDLYRGSAVESNESSENIRDIAREDTSIRDLKGIDVEEERAFKLLFALAVKEYQDAQFILEYYHKKGIKNSINVLKALELYNKILEKYIDSDAQNKLKLLCRLWEGNIFYE
ncbi:5992_t:CDS:2 [Rhizophagus irregularis]|nr:5992_t:CDS:2 [Rhizophagus irregularis]